MITSLLHHYYVLFTSLLHDCYVIITFTILHHYYNIITHYYIFYYYLLLQNYYYVLLHHYYSIITLLLHYYYFIFTEGKSCKNDYIITCYAKGMTLLLHYYYVLLCHYYTGFYYYSLLPISISRTCRWKDICFTRQPMCWRSLVNSIQRVLTDQYTEYSKRGHRASCRAYSKPTSMTNAHVCILDSSCIH